MKYAGAYEIADAMKFADREWGIYFTSLRSNFMSEGHFILRKQTFIHTDHTPKTFFKNSKKDVDKLSLVMYTSFRC